MRLPVDHFPRHALCIGLVSLASAALSGCAGGAESDVASAPGGAAYQSASIGPAADYPVVVGDPYRIGTTLFTPSDTLNYDEVGYAAAEEAAGVSGAHHTLPVPSYVEVTSLDSGKTVLVRIERRGPMDSDALVALSPAAFAQLGIAPGAPVRVRRVNPPEDERAMLRAKRNVPPRMDTPEALLAVLKRRLPQSGSAQLARSEPPKPLASVPVAPSVAGRPAAPSAPLAAQATASPPRTVTAPALPPLERAQAPQGASTSSQASALPPKTAATRAAPAPRSAASTGQRRCLRRAGGRTQLLRQCPAGGQGDWRAGYAERFALPHPHGPVLNPGTGRGEPRKGSGRGL